MTIRHDFNQSHISDSKAMALTAALMLFASAAAGGCMLEDESALGEDIGASASALWSTTDEVRSGVYANRCLEVEGGVAGDWVNVRSNVCNGSTAQKWTMNGRGELQSALDSNFCLDVLGAQPYNNTNVQVYTCNGTDAQNWTLSPTGELRSAVGSNLCLDVSGGSDAPGANVQIYECNQTAAQQWFQIPSLPNLQPGDPWYRIDYVGLGSGGTNSLVGVSPGQEFTADFYYALGQATWCPDCIDQIMIGYDDSPQGCIYDGIPTLDPEGTSGQAPLNIVAPSTPGVYYLRTHFAMQYSCNLGSWVDNGESTNIAVFTVR